MEVLSILFICFTQSVIGWFYILMLAAAIICLIFAARKDSWNLLMLTYAAEAIAGIVAIWHTIFGNSWATIASGASILIFLVIFIVTLAVHFNNRQFFRK